MSSHRRFELDELTNRPGTYFNPQTEVLIVVDDSPDVDHEIFGSEEFEADEWVLISDETPVDEHARDDLLERFQVNFHTASGAAAEDEHDEDLDPEEDELEPDEEQPEL
jgi:hypothetical protein